MTRTLANLAGVLAPAILFIAPAISQPLTNTFTYQGILNDGAAPANGSFDIRFRLLDQLEFGGTQIGPTLCFDDVAVVDGRFTAQLDFGVAFNGQRRFLEIAVRPGTAGTCNVIVGYTLLSPRQELTASPYSLFALSAANATSLNGQPSTFFTNASNLNAGTISDLRLSTNIATNAGTQTFSGNKTFSAAPTFSAAGTPFSVSGTGLVSNLNADLLDGLSSNAFAPTSHTHDGAAITSGLLNDARLSTNIPRLSSINAFSAVNSFSNAVGLGTTAPTARLHIVDGSNLPSTLTESSQAVFKVTNGTGGGILMDSNQIESVGGPLYLNFRGDGAGNDISLVAGGGDVGIGTGTPNARLEVVVAPTQSFQFRQDGFVPGINVASEGANAGIMRLRNAVEIWPSDNAARAGKLDIRNTSGNATITLNGATGNATYNNQPAIKTVESGIGSSANLSNDSLTLIEEASVTIPGDGFLHITAQAPVYIGGTGFSDVFLELKETTGAETLIDENWVGAIGSPSRTIVSLSHTIPVSAGVRRFKIRVRHAGTLDTFAKVDDPANSNGRVRASITLMYFPRGL
jgi:hypothetical protein